MKRLLQFALALMFSATLAHAQDFNYKWTVIPVDSRFDQDSQTVLGKILADAREGMGDLFVTVAVSDKEMDVALPESSLTNLTADIVRHQAAKLTGLDVDCAFYNVGGIRKALPKGDVTIDDVNCCYPFNNTIVVAEIKGTALESFFRDFVARKSPQAISGVNLIAGSNGELISLRVNGRQVEPDRLYRLATISFLLDGGDKFFVRNFAENVIDTKVRMKDAVLDYMKECTEAGRTLNASAEGRYIVER